MFRWRRTSRARPKPRIPPGTLVYAVGDLHGRADLLARLHDEIARDAAARDAQRRVVVYLGDYCDRGPDTPGVIDTLLNAPLDGFEAVHLQGNHDAWMRAFLDDPEVGFDWLPNGGRATLAAYGIDPPDDDGDPLAQLDLQRAALAAVLPVRHKRFLESLRATWQEGGTLFVHAGLRPGVPLARQSARDLMWIREPFLSSRDSFEGRLVVHGHSVTAAPDVRWNRIGLDTGAYASGRLSAAVLTADGVELLST